LQVRVYLRTGREVPEYLPRIDELLANIYRIAHKKSLLSGIYCTNNNALPTAPEQSLQTSFLPIFSTCGARTKASQRLYMGRKGQKHTVGYACIGLHKLIND
jgi:hypothetical protein